MPETPWVREIDGSLKKSTRTTKNQPTNNINQKQQLSQHKMLQKYLCPHSHQKRALTSAKD